MSGNGQVLQEYMPTVVPLMVQALDAQGNPAANVPITWAFTKGQGTLIAPVNRTDANGYASTHMTATGLMLGVSFEQQEVTASSPLGNAKFTVTITPWLARPVVQLQAPNPGDTLRGAQNSVLPSAIKVQVIATGGVHQGQGVPGVGMRVINALDATATPPAVCANGEGGLALTADLGIGLCDLRLTGPPGHYWIAAVVGENVITSMFQLQIEAGASCSYTLSSLSQNFAASGGTGTVGVTVPSACAWTASSTANWISITSGAFGSGNGSVAYSVSANTGAARTGTLSIGGQTFTVTQAAAGVPSGLAITTGAVLPAGTVQRLYAATIGATGGQTPYAWSVAGALPPGLTLNAATGAIAGTPTTPGMYSFALVVRDAANTTATRDFSLTVQPAGGAGPNLTILNVSFPNATVGAAYQQTLSFSGGCTTPFSPVPAFSVYSGSLPPGLEITSFEGQRISAITGTPTVAGTYPFALQVVDVCGGVARANFTIVVVQGSSSDSPIAAAPASVQFTSSGAAPADQTVVLSSASPVAFTASVSGGDWLSIVGPGSGATPAALTLRAVNLAGRAPGTYSSSLVVTPAGGGSPRIVPVTLTVTGASGIVVSPGSLDFTLVTGGGPGSLGTQTLEIRTEGSPVAYTASTNGGDWLTLSKTSGTAPDVLTVRVNANGLAAGLHSSDVVITPAGGGTIRQIRVTLRVIAPPSFTVSDPLLSFSAASPTAVPEPRTVSVQSTGASIAFLATASAAWVTISPSQGVTPQTLNVSVHPAQLQPGTHNAELRISSVNPGSQPVTIPISLTVGSNQPVIASIVNAASFLPGPIAPGELVTIFGSNLGPAELATYLLTSSGMIETTLAETQVLFDGRAAPIVYTSARQLTVVAPFALAEQASTRVQVRYRGQLSTPQLYAVAPASPGIFMAPGGAAAALNQDGSYNTAANGAAPGSIVSLWLTGTGATMPRGIEGTFVPDAEQRLEQNAVVEVGGLPAEVVYAGGAPALPTGMTQINVRLPESLERGKPAEISVRIGETARSQAGLTLFVAP